jgi:catechol 2,3-dioxygenase-like lactoylglutathione lyase family enzyme
VAFVVSDLERAKRLWCDVLGFEAAIEFEIPDGPAFSEDGIHDRGPDTMCTPRQADDALKVKDAHAKVALCAHPDGAQIELLQPTNPDVQQATREMVGYGRTGITECGLEVTDIETWFKKIRDAGYTTQADYIWPCGKLGRSFLFYDDDGSIIQIWEQYEGVKQWDVSASTGATA